MGGVVQFFDKVVDLWLPWGRLWWSCSSWTRLLTCPLLSLLGFVFFLVSRVSVTCLLGFEQGVYVFFVGVKGVVDVLAGLCLGVYFFVGVKGVDDVLAGRSGALRSRQGRLTCLLGVEQGIHVFFAGVKDVGDVLAGRGAGC